LRIAHPPPYVADAAPPRDIFSAADLTQVRTTHLNLDLDVDFDHYLVRGSATESIVNLTGTHTFVVDTRNLDIESVTIDGEPATWSLEADSRNGRPLTIGIEPSTTVVRIEYATKSDPKSATLSWLPPLTTIGGVAPVFYTNGEPDFTRGWIPIQDTPGVRMTYSAHIRVPPGLLAVMSATNPTETSADGSYFFNMAYPIPPYLIALAVGRLQFHALSDRTGFYAEPEVVDDAAWDMQSLPSMFDTFQHLLGPYPFDRYDVILMPPAYPGGMENPQANFINMLNCVTENHEPPVPSLVIAHELSHSWSGDMVTCATWNDTWLNEGFATYFENRILDEMGLPERAQLGYYFSRSNFQDYTHTASPPAKTALHRALTSADFPLSGFSPASYDKGGIFLEMLEESMGRPAFDAFLRDYFDRNRLHWADDLAFVAALRDHVPSLDALQINTWLYSPGLPSNVTAPLHAIMWDRDAAAATALASGTPLSSLGANTWTPYERDIFLWNATNTLPAHMAEVDATFHLSSLKTASVHWYLAVASTLYAPALPMFEQFLMRGANVIPVYQRLAMTAPGLNYALQIYARARAHYDWNTQANVDTILGYHAVALRDAA
jgi:aminopeptidase N